MKKLLLIIALFPALCFGTYSNSTAANGVSTTPAVTVPAGEAANDIVILTVNVDSNTATITWPASFTGICTATNTNQITASAWKRLSGADAGSYTMGTLGSSLDWTMTAVVFSGRDTTNPPVCGTITNNTTSIVSPVTVTAPAVTALLNDDIHWVGGLDVNTAGIANVWTAPASYTLRQSPESTPGWADHAVATRDAVAAGTTGAVAGSVTLTSTDTRWSAYLIRIPVAAAAGAASGVSKWDKLIKYGYDE